jgi:death-on-curing protein
MTLRFIGKRALCLLHDESLAEHGGSSGLRDAGLLDSALARPEKLVAYGESDVADLASCYAFGLAKNHPFVDGNKRAAFLAVGLCLYLNGGRLVATQVEATASMLALAAGELDEASYAAWIRARIVRRVA